MMLHELSDPQPQGITLARIDGPTTDDVTMRESGECEIMPSTDVKYPQGSITSLRNQWLLIGGDLQGTWAFPASWLPEGASGFGPNCWCVLGDSPICSAWGRVKDQGCDSPSRIAVALAWGRLQPVLVPLSPGGDPLKQGSRLAVVAAVPLCAVPGVGSLPCDGCAGVFGGQGSVWGCGRGGTVEQGQPPPHAEQETLSSAFLHWLLLLQVPSPRMELAACSCDGFCASWQCPFS